MSDVHEVLEWLAGGALSGPQSQDVLAQLCERMVEAGIPLLSPRCIPT
jgi:glycine cleavage system aminomethyltransferase T